MVAAKNKLNNFDIDQKMVGGGMKNIKNVIIDSFQKINDITLNP